MEFIAELILQFLGELLLQLVFESLAKLGFRSLASTVSRPRHPALAIIGFVLWGAIAGGISLWIFPTSPIADVRWRQVNLFLTPVLVGGIMMGIGRRRSKRGQLVVRLDQFSYAFVFAFAMAVVRYVWAA